ncbi:surfactin family lipopeptide synthetase A [Flavobacterium sp. CF108]|uniref:non-ribosomal peptide synthetase n=1 Tax=unclassified Flavobacterium TaxID=196869 RepID=UPI0008CFEDF8|nr:MULTISPECIES: non-ribosomal peptide synthetase [unclassified Flavobacterium]SEO94846.1 surfactin family lipopeptide synthetase A [Flavobacterium sp. fv08]SHH82446.1 surfactin family lipopeptide synthetase A [Flavobacterium sp. CF108]
MEELFLKLKNLDVHLSVEDGNLKLSVPDDFEENDLIDEIKKNKIELIDYIYESRTKNINSLEIPKKKNAVSTKLTPPQARLYVLQGLAKDSNVYNIPFASELIGAVDVLQLQKAFIELIQRHESLRTSFLLDNNYEPIQKVLEKFDFELEHIKSDEKGLKEIVENFSFSFNLEKAPLVRAKLVELQADRFILLMDVHHIIFDGISLQVFLRDLVSLYSKQELPELTLQYKDYADWYFSEDYQKNLSLQKAFWLKELNGFKNTAILPADFKKSNKISFEGAYANFIIKGKRRKALEELAKKSEASLFSVLTSLYSILQAKLTGIDDLAIGTPVAGRRHWSLENMIGMFVNTLAIRINFKNEISFNDYLKEVSSKIIHCFDNQEYPFEALLDDLGSRQSNEMNPFFNTLITLDNFEQTVVAINDLEIKPFEINKSTSKFDLIMHFSEKENELACTFEYSTQLFKKETIERFFDYFINILDQVAENESVILDKITLLDQESSNELLQLNDFTDVVYDQNLTIIDLFEEQVVKSQDNTALVLGNETLSYKELNERANQVARLLRAKGLEREGVVGILMEKSFEVIIGMLGILKAGGVYVPIDVNYPQNRIDYIVENSGLKMILTIPEFENIVDKKDVSNIFISEADQIKDTSNLDIVNSPNDMCYIIYTSGTTGVPKGVMVEHRNVVRLLFNKGFQFDFTDKDVWTMFHSHCFDFSVWEMYGPLLYGGVLIIITTLEARDPSRFVKIMEDNKVTVLNQTPTSFYNLIRESIEKNANLKALRYVVFGGEALTPSKLNHWRDLYPNTKLINMYGITEVTVHMTYKEIGDAEIQHSISNIGKALPTGSIYLLDNNMKPVPVGVIGEIYVGGEGVARGYMNNKELTDSRFIKNPFKEGDRLYRSGDLAVLLENGDLEYKRRSDNQIQLKGFRIELKEIEHHLYQHKLIDNAVVIMRVSKKDEPYLCAYYVGKEELDINNLRSYLEELLPHYMIPSFYVKIEEMPFTSNNKIDIAKLPEPKIGFVGNYIAPTNEEEQIMCEIWAKYMDIEQVGIMDNFFSLGGDSLRAIALISTINEKLSASLMIADLYSFPTIKELVVALKSNKGEEQAFLKKEAVKELKLFQETYRAENEFLDNYEEVYPMNGIEKGMVYYSLLGNTDSIHNIMYHEQNMYDVPFENFDFEIFKTTLNMMIKKHSELRKIYDLKNLTHIILKEIEPDVHFIDICHLSKAEQDKFIEDKLEEEKLRTTELSLSLIWRMHIIKVREGFQYLLFDFNHSLFDGWSLASFLTELNNTAIALKKDQNYLPKQIVGSYKDQILGELAAINSESSKNYWQKELSGYNRFELFPTGKPHVFITDDHDFGREYRKKLEAAASKFNTSFKHLCFSAIIYALRRINFENDITMGVVTNIRPLIPDGEYLLGCFLNTVPLRVQIPENLSWGEYVNFIEQKFTELKYHERVPFYKILEFIDEKTFNANPIFDVKLNYIDFRVYNDFQGYDENYFGPSNARTSYLNENTLLNLHIIANNDDFIFRIVYSTSFFEAEQSSKLSSYFKSTLDQILNDADKKLDDTCVLNEEEQNVITEEFNNTEFSFPQNETILDLFKEQVKSAPDNIAAVIDDKAISYSELESLSNQLSHKLIQIGVNSETLVPISLDRSLEMIIGILAILKAGGAYVPIDPTYPQNRIDYILEDIQSSFILTESKYENSFDIPKLILDDKAIYDKQLKSAPEVKISETSLAYVIYTSGTSGKPKGVMNSHEGIYNRLAWMRDHFNVTSKDNILQKTNFCFDVSVWELILPLITGAKLVFAKPEGHKETTYLEEILDKENITLMHFVPSMLSAFLINLENFNGGQLRSVICSGEELKAATLKDFQTRLPGVSIYNLYGPTEAAIDVTAIDLTNQKEGKVSIGKPIANTQLYIVDSECKIQSVGVKGELLIGGIQVAKGYLNKPELTSQKFINNPFNKKDKYKLYKTGDMARWLPDGNIEYLGRIDGQIKLRGNRIELGEIESYLIDYPEILAGAVDYRKYNNDYCIVAYYVAENNEKLELEQLKNYLAKSLPAYMIPSYFVKLNELPITSNGKLNRSALPDPEILSAETYVKPSNETEEKLVEIWSEILSIEKEKIGVETNFFDIGGHSLKVITLVNTIFKVFAVDVALSQVFEKQTVKGISDYIITVKQMESDTEKNQQKIKLFI